MKLSRIACLAVLSILCVAAMSTVVQAHPTGWVYQEVGYYTYNTNGQLIGIEYKSVWCPADTCFMRQYGFLDNSPVYFSNLYGTDFGTCTYKQFKDAQA